MYTKVAIQTIYIIWYHSHSNACIEMTWIDREQKSFSTVQKFDDKGSHRYDKTYPQFISQWSLESHLLYVIWHAFNCFDVTIEILIKKNDFFNNLLCGNVWLLNQLPLMKFLAEKSGMKKKKSKIPNDSLLYLLTY